jgi:4-hydroxy-tetrahydrodipicolinate synthase
MYMSISLREKIKGPVYSIITPFKTSEEIDYDSLRDYIKYLYNGGARLFYAMAFNTRYLLMTNDEILKINRVVCETIKSFNDPDTVIIVGDPLHCSTATSIEFAKHAKAHGADIISLIFRAYIFNDDQVYQHYKRVANEVPDIGILVHEMPFMKGIPDHQDGSWSMPLLDRLADIPQVVAVKEDAKNDEYTKQVVDLMSDRAAIITSGNGLQQWRKVSDKCQAWLTGIGNLFPGTELEFYREHLSGNTKRCDEIIDTVEKPFFWVKDNLGWHLGIKSALECLGVMSRDERMPYIPLDNEKHKLVCDIINDIKL